MPRRREVPKRKILPDPKFRDRMVAKFTNVVMIQGKKSVAEGIVYGAFDVIQSRYKEEPLEVFRKALDAVKPRVEVKSCLLYTSDAADERSSVDRGGRRI